MPELSRFFGIIIRMFIERGSPHHMPHIHAAYGEHEATFSIADGRLIAGFLPTKERKFVEVWVELRKNELLANWRELHNPVPTFKKVEPLK